jgi:hypothetical protein
VEREKSGGTVERVCDGDVVGERRKRDFLVLLDIIDDGRISGGNEDPPVRESDGPEWL